MLMRSRWPLGSSRHSTRRARRDLVDPSALRAARASSSRCEARGRWQPRQSGWPASSTACAFWGLPLQVVESEELPAAPAPALFLNVILTDAKTGETPRRHRGELLLRAPTRGCRWARCRSATIRRSPCSTGRPCPRRSIGRSPAPSSRSSRLGARSGSTTLKVENRLPFTISNLVVRAGSSSGSPSVPFEGVGVGPARSALLPIQAATASLVETSSSTGFDCESHFARPVGSGGLRHDCPDDVSRLRTAE